jgi:hypothetical protein
VNDALSAALGFTIECIRIGVGPHETDFWFRRGIDPDRPQYIDPATSAEIALWREAERLSAELASLHAVAEAARPALVRFLAIVEDLECQCDSYHGFTCSLHKDRDLARATLAAVDALAGAPLPETT